MGTKRIIPCLDIIDGRVVKGVNFEGIRDAADPVELAGLYCEQGADAVVFYDITASVEGKKPFSDVLSRVAAKVTVPFIIGGGLSTIDDCERAFSCGAAQLSINSGAIKNPQFLEEAAKKYGSGRIIISADIKRAGGKFMVFAKGGKENTGLDALEWLKKCEALGAGEIVANSIDTDGVKKGFDLTMLEAILNAVSIPVIASGGAGKKEDFYELFKRTDVDAGLAASVFHFREIDIKELKEYLKNQGINVKG